MWRSRVRTADAAQLTYGPCVGNTGVKGAGLRRTITATADGTDQARLMSRDPMAVGTFDGSSAVGHALRTL